MSINSIKFITSASATATNGSKTITVTGNVDCRNIYSGSAVFLGTRQVVEAVAGTAPNASGASTITLRNNWLDPNTTARLVVFNSIEGLAEAIRRAREITKASELIAGELNPLAELETLGFIERTGQAEWQTFQATALGKAILAAENAGQIRQALGLGNMATAEAGTEDDQYRNNSQNDARFAQLAQIQTNAQREMLEAIKAKATLWCDFVNNKYRVWEAPHGQEPKQLTDVITTTRASDGTVNTPFGVQTRAANIARIEYDPATGEPIGLLCEERRTNLVIDNNRVDATSWGKANPQNMIFTTNYDSTPDGTNSVRVQMTPSSLETRIDQSFVLDAGEVYILSYWVRRGQIGVASRLQIFNPQTYLNSNITLTDNWTRIVEVFTAQLATFFVRLRTPSSVENVDVAVSEFSLTKGAFVASQITTGGGAVTRVADTNYANIVNKYTTQFTMYWRGLIKGVSAGALQTCRLFSVAPSLTAAKSQLAVELDFSGGQYRVRTRNSIGLTELLYNIGTTIPSEELSIGVTVDKTLGAVRLYVNGALVGSLAGQSITYDFTNYSFFKVGFINTDNAQGGSICAEIGNWPRALSYAEMIALTSGV